MPLTIRLKRLKFRAEHRGTREADMVVGGFFRQNSASWSGAECDWFEAFLEEQDVDIMAWAMGAEDAPVRWQGKMMMALQRLDYISVAV